ncbi:TetR/AcrR family transcriptional regulator [Sphingomonas sp. CJ99]
MAYDRITALDRMADHVLASGLGQATLRPLAIAAGTSDRMLIYHFGTKSALVAALLDHLAHRMQRMLDAAVTPPRFDDEDALVATTLAAIRSDAFAPYVRIWLEMVAAAARGEAAYRETGERIARLYLDWLAHRHPAGAAGALEALRRIEGTIVLDAVGIRDAGASLTPL